VGSVTFHCEWRTVVVHLHDSALESGDEDDLGVGEDWRVLVGVSLPRCECPLKLFRGYTNIEDIPCQIAERTDHVRVECYFGFGHFVLFCNFKVFFLSGLYG
jgi:hypothetical protein